MSASSSYVSHLKNDMVKIDLRINGKLCLDNMQRYEPTKDAYVDPLTQIWSKDLSLLLGYMKSLGITSINHSKKIVEAMRRFEHWMGYHLILDTAEILKDAPPSDDYKYYDPSLRFYSNSFELLNTSIFSYYLHINVGYYEKGDEPQPNLSSEAGRPISYINRIKNYMFANSKIDRSLTTYFAMDDEASYSVSDGIRAEQMATILSRFIKHDSKVIDMTSCVGGNVIAFSKLFYVRAQEIDPLRYTLLRYNCEIAEVPSNKYLVWCVDSLKLFNKPGMYNSDCVYCDPPWGGPEYEQLTEMDLTLGPMNLIDIALNALRETKIFMCRTTFNYNRRKFTNIMESHNYRTITYVTYGKNKLRPLFYLLLVMDKNFKPYLRKISNGTTLFKIVDEW